MKKIIATTILLTTFLLTNQASAKQLQFAHFSDIHLSLTEKGTTNLTEDFLKKAIQEVNKNKKIKFVIFSGGNINSADKKNLKAFLKLANKLDKPYYVTIGDKEVLRRKNFSKKQFMHTVWRHHMQMLFKKPNYVFKPNRELVFISVDGTNEVIPMQSGYFKPETLDWLDKQLTKYKNKKVVLVQHFPIIPPKSNVTKEIAEPEKYFHVINGHENVIAILSGHFHKNNTIYKKGIYHLSAPAFAASPHEYKIITIEYEPKYLFSNPAEFSIEQQIVAMEEIPEDIPTDNGIDEETMNTQTEVDSYQPTFFTGN